MVSSLTTRTCTGSSPLARGLQGWRHCVSVCRGIIPARAGFTGVPLFCEGVGWDHPRSRGVYDGRLDGDALPLGSSPLARGLPQAIGVRQHLGRIIPARAGFTSSSSTPTTTAADHPRSRGVYNANIKFDARWVGSSPLARGLQAKVDAKNAESRIIPARAGFTCGRSRTCPPTPDHPRSRGVYGLTRLVWVCV